MKLDIFKNQWLEIVFEGRNKVYGAYELRKTNPKTTIKAFIIGSLVFGFLVSFPLLISLLPDATNNDTLDQKIVTVKLPPKEKPKENIPPPPPPPPKVDQVKFVKPVVAKAEEVTEEPPKVVEIKDHIVILRVVLGGIVIIYDGRLFGRRKSDKVLVCLFLFVDEFFEIILFLY